MTFLEHIDNYVFEHRHSKHSFVKSVISGRSTREVLRVWAIQKYHQVYDQNRVFSAIHSNCHYEDVRQFMLDQLLAEETNLQAGSASHYDLMKRFAFAMGATTQEIQASKPADAVKRFVNFLMAMGRRPSFLDGMLPVYINETQAIESAGKLYTYLREEYSLSDSDLEWFLVHSEVDKEHTQRARELMLKYAMQDRDFERRAKHIAKRACIEWLLLHEYYDSLLTPKVQKHRLEHLDGSYGGQRHDTVAIH
jgi:pyrroloquinoline-quinone synthase